MCDRLDTDWTSYRSFINIGARLGNGLDDMHRVQKKMVPRSVSLPNVSLSRETITTAWFIAPILKPAAIYFRPMVVTSIYV